MKSYMAVIAAMLISSICAQTCSFKLKQYSSTTCTGTVLLDLDISNVPIGVGTTPSAVSLSSTTYYMQVVFCDAELGVNYVFYSDAEGKTPVQADAFCVNMVCGFRKGDCFGPVTTGPNANSYQLSDVKLDGNKYGVGWLDGWGVLFCSMILFGLC